jgi:RND family efflux transporter MFP subunit
MFHVPSAVRRTGVITALVFLLGACGTAAPPAPKPPEVEVAAALAREVNDWDEFTGRLVAVDSVQVRPQVTGTIEQVAFEDGRYVNKGDLLFRLDDRVYRAALERAQAEQAAAHSRATLAREELARADRLLAANAVSREERAARAATLQQAEAAEQIGAAAVSTARTNLAYTRITAPISGRVGKAEITAGNLVTTGSSAPVLTTLVSVDPIYAEFEGDEHVYLKYIEMSRLGERPSSRDAANPVFLALAGEQGYPHEGRMVFVDNQLDPHTGTIRARAVFSNKDRRFTPGLFARLKLIGSGRHTAVLVDDQAIGTDQSQKFVLVVGKDGKAAYRVVKPGRLVNGLRAINEGLAAGEVIVVNGLQRLRPGMPLVPVTVAMDRHVQATETLPLYDPETGRKVRTTER